ncbi:MAG: hypothetical protein KGH81_08040, partial [Thaumarchaeota archaeon]|nr:hypothetical protein [Nitrososphaerota archaeon]
MPVKSIKQNYVIPDEIMPMLETFRQMVNHCIRIGLENNVSTLRKLSILSYHELEGYDIQSKYKLTAISSACGRLSQMKRSISKGVIANSPYVSKPYLVSCYGFKINGMLLSFPVGSRKWIHVPLNSHTQQVLHDKSLKVRSFTITPDSISLCIQKQVTEIIPENVIGIDRNLRNVAISDGTTHVMYRTGKLLSIKENTSYVLS